MVCTTRLYSDTLTSFSSSARMIGQGKPSSSRRTLNQKVLKNTRRKNGSLNRRLK